MDTSKIPLSFEVSVDTATMTPYELNPTMSKVRVSMFRKYRNFNGSYFSDEAANALIALVPGLPIVGCYDSEKGDFTRHFTPADTRAYGFIPPENPNFAWERRVEQDGQEFDYACFDAVFWTDRYEEAKQVLNKPQSMELNPTKTQGVWEEENEGFTYHFTLPVPWALCILGSDVAPCFDEACFFEKQEDLETILQSMREEIKNNFSLMVQLPEKNNVGGSIIMAYNFNLPQDNIYRLLFEALNPAVENDERIIENVVYCAGDNFARVYNVAENAHYTYEYSLDENGALTLGNKEKLENGLWFIDDAQYQQFSSLQADLADRDNTIATQLQNLAELSDKVTAFEANETELQNQINSLNADLASYTKRATDAENQLKQSMVEKYSAIVDADVINEVNEKLSDYSLNDLEAHLAINFARKNMNKGVVPNGCVDPEDPTLAALNNHVRNKGRN